MTRVIYIGFILALVGCSSSESAETNSDTGPAADLAEQADAGGADVSDLPGPDMSTDAGGDMGEPCDEDCRTITLTAEVGPNAATFDRAYYGVTSPDFSESRNWELHIEAHRGGASGCPDQNSPTPDQTLIVTGIRFPEVPLTVTDAEGLVVSLLDFQGELTTEPVLAANGEELTWTLWSLCLDCEDDPTGFVAFDLSAPLPNGDRVFGHGYATHCPSMDQR